MPKDTTITRRALLQCAAWSGAAAAIHPAAAAAGGDAPYPSRPVTWVIPFAPGGATGRLSVLICDRLTRRLGQAFVLDHRPGAGGNVATKSVASAAPDGYTILATSTANVINASRESMPDPDSSGELVPVAGIARLPLLLLVNKELPVKTLAEFLAYARANPGKLSVGSAGPGTVQLLSAELFRTLGGISWSVVQYRGSGPALIDLASGHIHAMFDNTASAVDLLRSGKVRALAVSTRERAAAFPDIPPVADVLPAFETSGFYGVAAPRGTPKPIVELLNREINAALLDPEISRQFAEVGATPIPGDTGIYAATYRAEIMHWRKLVPQTSAKN